MRSLLLVACTLVVHHLPACTVFTVSRNGHTYIGCNEDAWSINAQVRFEPGRNGDYGAIYFDHFNGSPLREMGPQLGMNEAGLVFDGLTIQPRQVAPAPGRRYVRFDELMPMLMRTCATVHEAATRMRTHDFSWLTRSMLFFADRNGDYLIVENDTMILGHDPWYAVGNWRMGGCSDPAAIPIPRLQRGRQLLMSGSGSTFQDAEAVLGTMTVCREKMGEGTLFSVLFDPTESKAHLYFYHDMREHVTFDLKAELAKGDRTVAMASLFGPRPEFDALLAYRTPFHQRWLFWAMLGLASFFALVGLVGTVALMRNAIERWRRNERRPMLAPVSMLLTAPVAIVLLGALLLNEGAYYFGLADVDAVLAWLPLSLLVLSLPLLREVLLRRTRMGASRVLGFFSRTTAGGIILLLVGSAYWGVLLPW